MVVDVKSRKSVCIKADSLCDDLSTSHCVNLC